MAVYYDVQNKSPPDIPFRKTIPEAHSGWRPVAHQEFMALRIGIDFRFLSSNEGVINRGTGRYTQQQLREVLRLDQTNEYVLILMPGANRSLILPEIRAAHNLSIATAHYPALKRDENPCELTGLLRHSAEFQEWVYRMGLDVYHATMPMLRDLPVWTHFNVCPVVATFYDLIPLIFPDHYLGHQETTRHYYVAGLRFLQHTDHLIAISDSARQDAAAYLGYPRDRITLAYPIPDPQFRRLSPGEAEGILSRLRARVGIPQDFVLCVSGLHHSKNLETLFMAYSRLSPAFRQRLPLLLTFETHNKETQKLRQRLAEYGIEGSTVCVGYVSDLELSALYNKAAVVVHPSRYEGFGLPVVEAMLCGAPVITTTSSSLPEVGGDAALLIDPDDVAGLAQAIEMVATDPERREFMRESGFRHAGKFDASQLGQATIDSYRQAVITAAEKNHRRADTLPLRIALWTPVPPQRSGIADYSAELLEELETEAQVEIFVDDGVWPDDLVAGHHVVQHHSAFERRQAQAPFDVIVYQVGASIFHNYMIGPIQKWPGIVVLHDLTWGRSRYFFLKKRNQLRQFRHELKQNEGKAALKQFEKHIQQGDEQALEAFLTDHFMLKNFLDISHAAIVHMKAAQQKLNMRYNTDVPVFAFPQGVRDPWRELPPYKRSIIRDQYGVKPDTVLVGVFGIVDPVKRIETILRALAQLTPNLPNIQLVIVGETLTRAYEEDLEALILGLNLESSVRLTGFVSQQDYDRWLIASDIVVNLRFPARGQMSATLMRAIAAGKPVIISDIDDWRDFPEDFCMRVATDEREVQELAQHLRKLSGDPILRRMMGESARRYYEEYATIKHMARHYLEAIAAIRK